ncbi:MAG: DNA-binding protein [Candidatus Krumholzibacteriia bacterium]
MSRRTIVGVMGGSVCDEPTARLARALGGGIARAGWVLLSGGRPTGVMQASVAGAHEAGGLTVGVLFDDDREGAAAGLDLVIPTGMGAARNIVNVLASDVVVACRGNGGTLSEIAMALRFGRPVVLLDFDPGAAFLDACGEGTWSLAATPDEAVAQVRGFLAGLGRS